MIDERTRRLGAAEAALIAPPADRRSLAPGAVVGDWQVVRRLGGGGFGAVYEATHVHTHQRAALKVLHAHLATSAEMLARFEREVQVIRRLDHPNIVRLVAAGFSDDGSPYLCMELLDGADLVHVLARGGRLRAEDALAILDALCDALALAHERGIVHRDIKAGNVFVCRTQPGEARGRIVLLDFGIAKISDACAAELTATSQTLGTPSCMAPEQIQGRRADARTDIYALGVLLFHMLTGTMPLFDPSATMTHYLHLHARRPRASTLVALPARLDDVIVRAMAIEPAERFADPLALIAAARAALRTSAVVAAVEPADSTAILVSVRDRGGGAGLDASLLADLEDALPTIERTLIGAGFSLAVDLGSGALFVARVAPQAGLDAAQLAWTQLRRTPRHPRVQVGLCVHRGSLSFLGGEIQASALLRPSTWQVPEAIEGVWVTSAIDPSASNGRRVV